MGKYKVVYFDFTGRAETTRMLLHMAGQEFEDVRYSREEWPKYKDGKYCYI